MPQSGQPLPSENDLNPWRVTQCEVALGIGIFILVYAIGVGRLVWREIFQNNADTQQETFPAITTGMADATLAGAGLATFAIVGTKTVRLVAGRIFGPGNTRPRRYWTLPAQMPDGWTISPPGRDQWRAANPDGQ